jgi:hypothetical protein
MAYVEQEKVDIFMAARSVCTYFCHLVIYKKNLATLVLAFKNIVNSQTKAATML